MTDALYNPFVERAGVARLKHKKQPAIDRRVDKIVALNKRYEECIELCDYWGLIELSYEYDLLKWMHDTANRIRAEAEDIERMKA